MRLGSVLHIMLVDKSDQWQDFFSAHRFRFVLFSIAFLLGVFSFSAPRWWEDSHAPHARFRRDIYPLSSPGSPLLI
jgi:hypothetical protein